jgi:hypothetical protein
MFEAYVANDMTGGTMGADQGSVGNYDISLSDMAHRSLPAALPGYLGKLKGLERTPWHRLEMAEAALARVRETMEEAEGTEEKVGWRKQGDEPNKGLPEFIDEHRFARKGGPRDTEGPER